MAQESINIGDLVLAYGIRNSMNLGIISGFYFVPETEDMRYDIHWLNNNTWGTDTYISESTARFYRNEYVRWRNMNL